MTYETKGNMLALSLRIVIVGATLGLLLQGCASVQENTALTSARAAYEKAKGDPKVEANASVALYEAGKTLKRAETAEENAEVSHLAYLAEKQTAIAVATAEEKLAEAEREKLAEEKDKILLEHRGLQLREARGEAKTLASEAEKQRMKAAEERKRAEELERELAALKAKKTDRGYVLTLGDILFVTAKANLMPGAQRTIDQLAAFLNKQPAMKVVVEGHTDSRGSESYNMALSERRAESVRSALMARGIASDRVTAKGMGELYPVANNARAAGRQQNRRVEILFVAEGQTPAQR